MTHIELAPGVVGDFDRIFDRLIQRKIKNPTLHIRDIIEAINALEYKPMIGHGANNTHRELVIGRRCHGSIVSYHYDMEEDTVFILAVSSQIEAGYTGL
jgi:hypothetical protein